MKNRIHVLSKPEQPRRECQRSKAWENRNYVQTKQGQPQEDVSVQWLVKNQIHVHTKPGQPRRVCQRLMACGKSNLHTA